ncbi:MAG: hypothetical protein IMF05_12415, partial [Proteobacteria bacterium]|nr:hypothetical protein [Pseudomonadota bacterium]
QAADHPKTPDASLFGGFIERRNRFVSNWTDRISDAAGRGGVAIWGAGAKGVTFSLLTDPARESIDCLIDINPGKQGNYVPLTGHAIVSPEQAAARGIRTVIVANPIYADEVAGACRLLGMDVGIIPLS